MSVIEGQFEDAEDDETTAFEFEDSPAVASPTETPLSLPQEEKHVHFKEDIDEYEENEHDVLEDDLLQKHGEMGALSANVKHFQPYLKSHGKHFSNINLSYYEKSMQKAKDGNDRFFKSKDKSEQGTVENVLDGRTKAILFKLLDKGVFNTLNGVISTGKEANVYHATTKLDNDKAVKIYKTSILTFKDRDQYITGEFRFRRGYGRKNPRKMVNAWAEKEARNLVRIAKGGVRCPSLHLLKGHVLVMEFIGTDGWPAPLLKDVNLKESQYRQLYLECVHILRRLYQDCKLVHADLSEYNLLYHDGGIVVIDVSQSVEHDHPHSLDFLRKDCHNINDFFGRNKVSVLGLKDLFDFVTDVNINEGNIDARIDVLMKTAVDKAHKSGGYNPKEHNVDQEVFKKTFIPRNVDEVIDYKDLSLYQSVIGVDLTDKTAEPSEPSVCEQDSDDNSAGESGSENDEEDGETREKNVVLSRKNMTKEEMKEHKKRVKEENRERRKDKIPKHVKKRKEKMTTHRRK